MKDFLIQALNSTVGERLADCLFVCAIVMLVQFFYNKKLAEHQTRFKYWHEEKAKAIKEFYYSAVLLHQEMKDYHAISKKFAKKMTVGIQTDLKERLKHIIQSNNTSYRDWTCLRLFLKNEELSFSDSYFFTAHSVFKSLSSQYKQENYTIDNEKIERELDEMSQEVESLREKLQAILKVQDVIFKDKSKKEQNKSPICAAPSHSSEKDDVK